jgi:hypothetical protein
LRSPLTLKQTKTKVYSLPIKHNFSTVSHRQAYYRATGYHRKHPASKPSKSFSPFFQQQIESMPPQNYSPFLSPVFRSPEEKWKHMSSRIKEQNNINTVKCPPCKFGSRKIATAHSASVAEKATLSFQ